VPERGSKSSKFALRVVGLCCQTVVSTAFSRVNLGRARVEKAATTYENLDR
jgi:hypothetical protein